MTGRDVSLHCMVDSGQNYLEDSKVTSEIKSLRKLGSKIVFPSSTKTGPRRPSDFNGNPLEESTREISGTSLPSIGLNYVNIRAVT